jgi:hypothetical protein
MTSQSLRNENKSLREAYLKQVAKLEAVNALCQRYAHPGVAPGTHALARDVLRLTGGEWGDKTSEAASV